MFICQENPASTQDGQFEVPSAFLPVKETFLFLPTSCTQSIPRYPTNHSKLASILTDKATSRAL